MRTLTSAEVEMKNMLGVSSIQLGVTDADIIAGLPIISAGEPTGDTPGNYQPFAASSPAPRINPGSGNHQPWFEPFQGKHSFDSETGFYTFISLPTGATSLSRGKKKNSVKIRLTGEFYNPELGDGLSGIGYSDGHVSAIRLPTSVYDLFKPSGGYFAYPTVAEDGTGANIMTGFYRALDATGEPKGMEAIE